MQAASMSTKLILLAQSADELTRSAESHHSNGIQLAQLAMLIFAGLFVFAAYTTAKNGFTITTDKKITGVPAYVIAGVFIALAAGIALFAFAFFPGLAI